jgi:hypothetical protein
MISAYDSDTTGALTDLSSSSNSIDDILNNEDADVPTDAWKSELHNRIEQIVDRKRSSTEGRTESLNAYTHILMARYAKEDIEDRVIELLPSILRSIKSEMTEREAVTALKGNVPPGKLHAAQLTN